MAFLPCTRHWGVALTLPSTGTVATAKQRDNTDMDTKHQLQRPQVLIFSKVSTVGTFLAAGVCFFSWFLALCFWINNLNSNDVVALQRNWLQMLSMSNNTIPFTQFYAVSLVVSAAATLLLAVQFTEWPEPFYYSTYGLCIKSRMYGQMETVNLMLQNIFAVARSGSE